jgi:uncharacterized protein (TIGR02996 family)
MGDRDPFEAAIDDAIAVGDAAWLAAARLVYADWLDEQGEPDATRLAEAQRWMAAEGKSPWPNRSPDPSPEYHGPLLVEGPWGWVRPDAPAEAEWRVTAANRLPAGLWFLLSGSGAYEQPVRPDAASFWPLYAPFLTRRDAERALAEALAGLAEGRGE